MVRNRSEAENMISRLLNAKFATSSSHSPSYPPSELWPSSRSNWKGQEAPSHQWAGGCQERAKSSGEDRQGQKKENTIKNAAHLEDAMDKEDKLRILEANHPPFNTQKKAAWSQRLTQAVPEGMSPAASTQKTTDSPPTDDDI